MTNENDSINWTLVILVGIACATMVTLKFLSPSLNIKSPTTIEVTK